MARLQEHYRTTIEPQLTQELQLANTLAAPRLVKIAVNTGWGEIKGNEALKKSIEEGLQLITGQKPVVTHAKKAIAGFKLRQNDPIGYRVTLRGARMYDFLDRLITYVLPRLRDFQGVATSGFDHHGNYSFGFREQTVFPEIPFQGSERTWGVQVTLVTTAKTDTDAHALLAHLGLPLAKMPSPKE